VQFDACLSWCCCLSRFVVSIDWCQRVSSLEVWQITEQPPVTSIIQKSRLMLFGDLARMNESADARRILTAVPQSDWNRPAGRLHTSWLATMKNGILTSSVRKMPPSSHWTDHSEGYWQQVELHTELVQDEQ